MKAMKVLKEKNKMSKYCFIMIDEMCLQKMENSVRVGNKLGLMQRNTFTRRQLF